MTIRAKGTLTGTPSKIRDASAILAAKTDELTDKIGHVQAHFASLRLGVETYVDITSRDERENNQYVHLWFEKENADWRLVIHTGSSHSGEELAVVNVVKAKKEFRIRSARALPQLLAKMIQEAERQIAEVEEAIRSVDKALANETEPVAPPYDGGGSDDEIPF